MFLSGRRPVIYHFTNPLEMVFQLAGLHAWWTGSNSSGIKKLSSLLSRWWQLKYFFISQIGSFLQVGVKIRLKEWLSRWWQLKYVFIFIQNVGFHDPIWRAYFSDGWFNHHLVMVLEAIPLSIRPFLEKAGWFLELLQDIKKAQATEKWKLRIYSQAANGWVAQAVEARVTRSRFNLYPHLSRGKDPIGHTVIQFPKI